MITGSSLGTPASSGGEERATDVLGQLRERYRRRRPPRWEELLVGFVLLACLGWAFSWVSDVDRGDPGIVEFQIAGHADEATPLFEVAADAGTVDELRSGLRRDLVLIPVYVLCIGYWCWWFGARHLRTGRLRRLMRALGAAVVVAGIADLVENRALGDLLDAGGRSDAAAVVATAAAIPKWVILAAALPSMVVVVGVAAARVVRGLARRRRWSMPLGGTPRPNSAPQGVSNSNRCGDNALAPPEGVAVGRRGPLGVCFSGGGIRSATFNMGALQVLDNRTAGADVAPRNGDRKATYLASATYLSCVSGGAYIAGALQMLSRDAHGQPRQGPLPAFRRCSPEEDFVRRHGRYLADTGGEWASALARVLAGVALNLLVFGLALFALGRPLGWVQHALFHVDTPGDDLRTTGAMWAAVGWTAGGGLLFYLVATVLGGVDGTWRRRCESIALGLLTLGTTVLAIVWLVPLLARVVPDLVADLGGLLPWGGTKPDNEAGTTVLVVAGTGTLAGSAIAIINRATPSPETGLKPRWPALSKARRWVGAALPYIAGALLGLVALVVLALFTAQAARTGIDGRDTIFGIDQRLEVEALALAAGVLVFLYAAGDQTRWSLAPFYKRRLASAFALVADETTATARPWAQETRLSSWAERRPGRPELLICAAANTSDPEAAPPGRRAQSFVFSGEWVGGPQVGWVRTKEFEAASCNGPTEGDGTLLGAVAISGAAFASAMGRHSKGAINSLLAASNARLGVWLPRPTYVDELHGGRPEPQYDEIEGRYGGTWARRRRLPYLFKELIGAYTADDRFVYLTDGGHYENLGLVELLRRRCRTIICFDASGDDLVTCGTFVEALALAREELGVEVTIDLTDLAPIPAVPSDEAPAGVRGLLNGRLSTRSVVHGTIDYPGDGTGLLILAKASLTATTPVDVLAHAGRQRKATFPNDSTGDQFFDHTQFNAYATLGRHIADEAIDHLEANL